MDTSDAQNAALVLICDMHVMTVTRIGHFGCSDCYSRHHLWHARQVAQSYLAQIPHAMDSAQGLLAMDFAIDLATEDEPESSQTLLPTTDVEISDDHEEMFEVSSDEVEILKVQIAEKPVLNPCVEMQRMRDEDKLGLREMTPEQEEAKMMAEIKYGYWFRHQDANAQWEDRVKKAREARASESSEARQIRKRNFRKYVHSLHL